MSAQGLCKCPGSLGVSRVFVSAQGLCECPGSLCFKTPWARSLCYKCFIKQDLSIYTRAVDRRLGNCMEFLLQDEDGGDGDAEACSEAEADAGCEDHSEGIASGEDSTGAQHVVHRLTQSDPAVPTKGRGKRVVCNGARGGAQGAVEKTDMGREAPNHAETASAGLQLPCNNTTSALGVDGLQDSLTCVICGNLMLPPLKQCVNGHLVCNVCLASIGRTKGGKSAAVCPTCRVEGIEGRNLALEHLASKRKWPCLAAHNGCKQSMEYCDLKKHKSVCRYNQLASCPIADCAEYLGVDAEKVCEHLSTQHGITDVLRTEADDGVFPSVVFEIRNYHKERVKKVEVFESSKLMHVNGVFFLLTVIESEQNIQFRSFFFTDNSTAGCFTMEKTLSSGAECADDQGERLCLSAVVKCITRMNIACSNTKKKQPSLGERKSLLNNHAIMLSKHQLSRSHFLHGDDTQLVLSIKISDTARTVHSVSTHAAPTAL